MKTVSISSPIWEKIAWAEACHDRYRNHMLSDPVISKLLEHLKAAVHASRLTMKDAGVAALCRACEEDEGGSCCGAGMEDRYDGSLLLINRLLDVRLPHKRRDARSCLFLGTGGCVLMARQVICINYMCRKITDRTDPIKIRVLRDKEGEEIKLLFLLQEAVNKKLRKKAI